MAVITLTPDQLDQLRPGDRLTHINGADLLRALTVVAKLAPMPNRSGTLAVEMRTPQGTPAHLYPDTHVDTSVTIERDEPAPARPRRPRVASRRVAGLTFTSDGHGSWFTDDRRYEISRQIAGWTECEQDHPVKITPALLARARENRGTGWAQHILTAAGQGRSGYLCPAGTEHAYERWLTFDHRTRDLTDGGYADSFTEAAENLSLLIAGK